MLEGVLNLLHVGSHWQRRFQHPLEAVSVAKVVGVEVQAPEQLEETDAAAATSL